jgi:hypothetical protein
MLYVHGGALPSSLSIAYPFVGESWDDAFGEAGFDVWGKPIPTQSLPVQNSRAVPAGMMSVLQTAPTFFRRRYHVNSVGWVRMILTGA